MDLSGQIEIMVTKIGLVKFEIMTVKKKKGEILEMIIPLQHSL